MERGIEGSEEGKGDGPDRGGQDKKAGAVRWVGEETGVESNQLKKMLNLFILSLLPSTAVLPDVQPVMVLIPFQTSSSLACSFLSRFRL